MNRKLIFTSIFIFLACTVFGQSQDAANVVKATLNGTAFIFDAQSGSILRMSHPATGIILETTADSAGLVDLAYPVKEFEPLRLASRYSKNAKITQSKGSITIHWDELGASRKFPWYKGKVSATVTFSEAPDGKSISLSCSVNNRSDHSIPQIIFPDFFGIVPFAGKKETEFRTGGTVMKPFVDMVVKKEHDNFYASYENTRWFHYGFVLDAKNLVIKWMDIGGRKGGLSIYSKNWGINKGYDDGVFLNLSEITNKLRYMKTEFTEIAPDSSWQSAEFILTPHENGWAEGIKPYREYANENIKRLYPIPDHVRNGLGYRTLWMRNFFYPEDPKGNNFRFSDLPKVARESRENGLEEMVLWGYNEPFMLPLPPPNKYLGTEQDLVNAVLQCRKIGVNVAPFRSVMIAAKTGGKYGLTPNTEYNYDPEFLPILNPRYAVAGRGGAMVPSSNKLWQQEALASCKHLIDIGIPSICWDQYFTVGPGRYMDTLTTALRKLAKEKDPQSTFSAEVGTNMENECDYLDYSWNWDYNDNCDYSALLGSLKNGPRINLNIDRSVIDVKRGFADNLYLNVYPRKPDGVNGSDYISNHPDISAALKQCARLRKQFLDYFVNGTFIGDCVLTKESTDAHVSAYALPKSMLVIVINMGNKGAIDLNGKIEPWLKSSSGQYNIKQYQDGIALNKPFISKSQWKQKTPLMNNLDVVMFEVIPQ